jgi:hypothetical protein
VRPLIGALCLCVLLALGGAGAPSAGAAGFEGSGSLQSLSAPEETTTTQATTTEKKAVTNSKSTVLFAIGGAVVLLCAIAFVIVRDARKVAPAGPEEPGERRLAHDPRVTLEKRRAKAKAARQQRKRNR